MKKQTTLVPIWAICLCFAFWFLYGIPALIGVILLFIRRNQEKAMQKEVTNLENQIVQLEQEQQIALTNLTSQLEQESSEKTALQKKLEELGADDYFAIKEKITSLENDFSIKQDEANKEISTCNTIIDRLRTEIETLTNDDKRLTKQVASQSNKLRQIKTLYKSMEHCIANFLDSKLDMSDCQLPTHQVEEAEYLAPSIILKLHCMDMKDLKKAYRENERQIDHILTQYASRYTTKSNQAIYQLMVIALRSELQNIIYNLKYEKLDSSVEAVKNVSAKYLKITGEGNQSIAGTLTKFIGEIEYLFINAVKIEYNYYVKKEQARQEQLAIREQMRLEAEERKALEAEKKKIEKEEAKFESQIALLTEQTATAADAELAALNARILELQAQLANVIVKKEDITKLQNGKAGNVYIISNLGSFGDNVFKIGMTRRQDPQDRVNELGDASVPFKFDVHSFIFSDDASALETELHKRLESQRVNKVNPRKEFFYTTIDELEKLVEEVCPTAEFHRTMLAEEYRQSISTTEVYSSSYSLDLEDEEDTE